MHITQQLSTDNNNLDQRQPRPATLPQALAMEPILWPPKKEVEIVKETYKGKELILIEDDEVPFVRQGQFRLMDLPAELRAHVYEHLLPCNKVLGFTQTPAWFWHRHNATTHNVPRTDEPEWRVHVTGPDQDEPIHAKDIQTQLFLVSKAVSAEAKGKPSPHLLSDDDKPT
jgi:hypothetical protein